MTLGYIISVFSRFPADKVLPVGFSNPHSYRGDYYCLAFEPKENVTVEDSLTALKSALGQTYEGYKGGEYTMDDYSRVYLAEYGNEGDEVGRMLLNAILGFDLLTRAEDLL